MSAEALENAFRIVVSERYRYYNFYNIGKMFTFIHSFK